MKFDVRQTNIAKGLAILFLIWHHLFFYDSEDTIQFASAFTFRGMPIESCLSYYLKICVSIFLFLSGYGLFKSWNNRFGNIIRGGNYKPKISEQLSFVKNRLIKLMFGFWFIYLIFVPLSIWFGTPFWEVYHGNPLYGIIDFLGLAKIFSTPTMNPTWWFMSIMVLLIILFPVLMKVFSYSGELMIIISVLLSVLPIGGIVGEFCSWQIKFVLGIYLADVFFFEKLYRKTNSWMKRILLALIGVFIFFFLGIGNSLYDTLSALIIVCVCYLILSQIPVFSKMLEVFGKYSAGIFMFHTFIYLSYFSVFIYSFKYPVIIYIVMTLICFGLSFAIEKIKQLIRLNTLIQKITTPKK